MIVQQPSLEFSGREKCTDDETLTAHVPGKKKATWGQCEVHCVLHSQ